MASLSLICNHPFSRLFFNYMYVSVEVCTCVYMSGEARSSWSPWNVRGPYLFLKWPLRPWVVFPVFSSNILFHCMEYQETPNEKQVSPPLIRDHSWDRIKQRLWIVLCIKPDFYVCMLAWTYVYCKYAVPAEASRGHQIPGNWSCRQFCELPCGCCE